MLFGGGISSTRGNAEIAASQLAAEKVADGDCETVSVGLVPASIGDWSSFVLVSGLFSGDAVSLSDGVGQIPSCSYRSKKLELVGGAFNDMLVDRDRGSNTALEPLRLIGTVADPRGDNGDEDGKAGSGDVGGGLSRLGLPTDVSIDNAIDDGVLKPDFVGRNEVGKYGGLGGSKGGDSVGMRLRVGRSNAGRTGSSSTDASGFRVEPSTTELTRLTVLLCGNSVFVGGALAGSAAFSRMFARLFALVKDGLDDDRNCLRSRRLGELRLRRALGGKAGDAKGDCGIRFEERSSEDAKGSAGSEGWEGRPKESSMAEAGGERGLFE
jgi:hypothetical protein